MTTTPTQQLCLIEVIYTFDDDRDQGFEHIHVAAYNGELSEAAVLHAILSPLAIDELQALNKVSLCLMNIRSHEQALALAPWLYCKDSPLCNGKLWLKQHLFQ